jgi:hypothetical protein
MTIPWLEDYMKKKVLYIIKRAMTRICIGLMVKDMLVMRCGNG